MSASYFFFVNTLEDLERLLAARVRVLNAHMTATSANSSKIPTSGISMTSLTTSTNSSSPETSRHCGELARTAGQCSATATNRWQDVRWVTVEEVLLADACPSGIMSRCLWNVDGLLVAASHLGCPRLAFTFRCLVANLLKDFERLLAECGHLHVLTLKMTAQCPRRILKTSTSRRRMMSLETSANSSSLATLLPTW